jgi:hypothetical protein
VLHQQYFITQHTESNVLRYFSSMVFSPQIQYKEVIHSIDNI